MQFCLSSYLFLPISSKYSRQHPALKSEYVLPLT
jgi:hypothetical protein